MGRPSLQVTTLHGHTIEELIKLKNTTDSKYTRLALTAITMRYSGYSNTQIIESTGLSKVSIGEHIKNWNTFGLKSVEDHRGGNRPTKADKSEQEDFKKMLEILDTLESSSDTVVYALDETKVCIESDNRSSWSPVGVPPVLEKNGSRKGINIIGSTCILSRSHTVNDVYSSNKSITSMEIKSHLEYLLEINSGKKIVVFLDNARIHTSAAMQEFYLEKKDVLKPIFMPKYSPNMNPQENI